MQHGGVCHKTLTPHKSRNKMERKIKEGSAKDGKAWKMLCKIQNLSLHTGSHRRKVRREGNAFPRLNVVGKHTSRGLQH